MTEDKNNILRFADRNEKGRAIGYAHEVFKRPPKESSCEHKEFDSQVVIDRLVEEKPTVFIASVTVWCRDCKAPFAFKGMSGGLNFNRPLCSADSLEARMPIEPSSSAD